MKDEKGSKSGSVPVFSLPRIRWKSKEEKNPVKEETTRVWRITKV